MDTAHQEIRDDVKDNRLTGGIFSHFCKPVINSRLIYIMPRLYQANYDQSSQSINYTLAVSH